MGCSTRSGSHRRCPGPCGPADRKPDSVGPGQCDAAPTVDGTHLYLASNGTTISGTAYDGSVREVNPATGQTTWETGLTGSVIGTPGMDGAGVIAAGTYGSTTGQNGVFLLDASTGAIVKTLGYNTAQTFGQPVFADRYLLIASQGRPAGIHRPLNLARPRLAGGGPSARRSPRFVAQCCPGIQRVDVKIRDRLASSRWPLRCSGHGRDRVIHQRPLPDRQADAMPLLLAQRPCKERLATTPTLQRPRVAKPTPAAFTASSPRSSQRGALWRAESPEVGSAGDAATETCISQRSWRPRPVLPRTSRCRSRASRTARGRCSRSRRWPW